MHLDYIGMLREFRLEMETRPAVISPLSITKLSVKDILEYVKRADEKFSFRQEQITNDARCIPSLLNFWIINLFLLIICFLSVKNAHSR